MQGSVTIPAASGSAAPEGHDAAMVARYEQGQAAAAAGLSAPPAEPTAAAPAAAPTAPATTPAAAPPAAPEGAVNDILTKAGLTRESLAAEYAAGGISEESFAKLATQGISKADFEQYMAGRQAQADAYESSVITATVGTPEKYAEVIAWAAESLSPAEKAAFNAEVSSGDPARAQLAVAGLQARHTVANPAEPTLLQKDNVTSGATAAYASWAQVTADMKNPLYAKDPAFREQVRQRLAASPDDLQRR